MARPTIIRPLLICMNYKRARAELAIIITPRTSRSPLPVLPTHTHTHRLLVHEACQIGKRAAGARQRMRDAGRRWATRRLARYAWHPTPRLQCIMLCSRRKESVCMYREQSAAPITVFARTDCANFSSWQRCNAIYVTTVRLCGLCGGGVALSKVDEWLGGVYLHRCVI